MLAVNVASPSCTGLLNFASADVGGEMASGLQSQASQRPTFLGLLASLVILALVSWRPIHKTYPSYTIGSMSLKKVGISCRAEHSSISAAVECFCSFVL